MSNAPLWRHVHLDPVGGIAGDMFVAAMLDLFPDSLHSCLQDLEASGVTEHVSVALNSGKSHGLAVQRFCVEHKTSKPRATGNYRDLRQFLQRSSLENIVCERALLLLELLALAESRVHGVDIDEVHFHEVADWDSIADIVAAASVIERNSIDGWTCSRLPVGSGLVKTEHGLLPIPAPATQVLLEGLITWDDGVPGERVTPTGAAIVRHLFNSFISDDTSRSLAFTHRPQAIGIASGTGAGQRDLPDRPNTVRCSLYKVVTSASEQSVLLAPPLPLDTHEFDHDIDQVAQLDFAIDDMTSEELAVALQFIRQSDGVLDVSHSTSFGKKGRMMSDVTVLCLPAYESVISRLCFTETSTLGMRVQLLTRRVLKRRECRAEDELGSAGLKLVDRPLPHGDQQSTLKVESDDLRRIAGLYGRRSRADQLAKTSMSKMVSVRESKDTK